MPVGEVMFFRSLIWLFPVLGYFAYKGALHVFWEGDLKAQTVRAAIAAVTLPCFIYAYSQLPLADAYAISFVSPFFMAIFSIPILKERVEPYMWWAILFGFCGVLIMMRPGSSVMSLGGLAAFSGGVLYGLAMVLSRKLTRNHAPLSVMVWFSVFTLLAGMVTLPFSWEAPSLFEGTLLAVTAILSSLAQLYGIKSLSILKAPVAGGVEYLNLVWGTFLGYFFWGDFPDNYIVTGAVMLVMGGLYLTYRETTKSSQTPPTACFEN
ncbi:DMT family transporter [Candidatus Bealeia paramacronuclearis]|uniref:DMT family transporter n=2 Tax=Candidatus Bealeia paramacronuclearis TaxID=1921001 RepID=A0ABZ2C7A4_9PROT|nr:DMT family transporter [Candidatus Bealeia paramacronuclearis]